MSLNIMSSPSKNITLKNILKKYNNNNNNNIPKNNIITDKDNDTDDERLEKKGWYV